MECGEPDLLPPRRGLDEAPIGRVSVAEVSPDAALAEAKPVEGMDRLALCTLFRRALAVLVREHVVEHAQRVEQVRRVIRMRHHEGRRLGRDDEVVVAEIERVEARIGLEDGIERRLVRLDRNFIGLVRRLRGRR